MDVWGLLSDLTKSEDFLQCKEEGESSSSVNPALLEELEEAKKALDFVAKASLPAAADDE